MATVSDITTTPHSGLNHIDALLDIGPDWNYSYLDQNGEPANINILYYTFSITSGNEVDPKTKQPVTGQEMFTLAQQIATRTAFSYLAEITGIEFVETAVGSEAQIHLANLDIKESNITGLCSWQASFSATDQLQSYSANAWVYLDNVEWRAQNHDLTPGGYGYETLLHELGHALGLRHPFHEADEVDHIHLSPAQDNTANTLMSYTDVGAPRSTFGPYDIAALNWLYGRDGLGGQFGLGTNNMYFTGTPGDDIFYSTKGNDMIDGNGGNNTVVYTGSRNNYTLSMNADGSMRVASAENGIDTLVSIEQLRFADMAVSRASLADTTAPAAPTFVVTKNANGYTIGSKPLINGFAEANSTVKVFVDDALFTTVNADANGVWSVPASLSLPDRMNYQVYATATDGSGNTSAASSTVVFHVDATAPTAPTVAASMATGGNQPVFSGFGEAGTMIELYRDGDLVKLGDAIVDSNGHWEFVSKPLPNANYTVIASSVDLAGNATSSMNTATVQVNSAANKSGTAGADTFVMTPGNVAVDGSDDIDTAVFSGAHSEYTIAKGSHGWSVTHREGSSIDLSNVERLQFSDTWFAIDEPAFQLFRLYRAALGRDAEPAGLGYWMDRLENGTPLVQVAHEFTWAPEFKQKYGDNPTDEAFITKLYANVLNRLPDDDGFAYWLTRFDDSSREQIMLEFSESDENKAQVLAQTSDGVEFTPYKQPADPATIVVMTPENVAIDGGDGIDTAVFIGAHSDYTIAEGSHGWSVTHREGGVDGLYDVERLQFSDTWFAIDETAFQVFRLYRSALGRDAEPAGLGYWMDRVDNGTPLVQVAHEFTWAPEFKQKYGDNPTDEAFITKLYANVLNRLPDEDGFAYWLTRVDDSSREQIMLEFSESLENKAQVLAKTSDGVEFTPYEQPTHLATLVGVATWTEPLIA